MLYLSNAPLIANCVVLFLLMVLILSNIFTADGALRGQNWVHF